MHMLKCSLLLPVLLTLCLSGTQAQKPFEGRIHYAIEYIEIPEELKGMEGALPRETLWVVSQGNTRMEQGTFLGGRQVSIHREGVDSIYQLIEVVGQKMLLSMPLSTVDPQQFRVTETAEVKNILGYETQHVVLHDGNGTAFNAWYTAKFRNPAGGELPSLKGLPLEYEFARSGIRVRMIATQLVEEPVDDTYFVIPSEYVRVPKDAYDRWLR